MALPTGDIEAPAVPPDVYDAQYYLESCAGAKQWRDSRGADADPLYPHSLKRAGLRAGEVVVDIGTGRGELLAVAVEMGAARAIGVEYSADAVRLARETLAVRAVDDRASVVEADARAVPLEDAGADLVTMLDVVEHLTAPELDRALAEARRILRPGGRIFIHTLPNRLIYDLTYRVQRRLTRSRSRTWPADPRVELERLMHVNEQTRRSLRTALRRAGFGAVDVRHGEWIHDMFVPDERARRLYGRLARYRVTRPLGAADLWASARRSR